jgi:hypothetical protein
MKGKSLFCLALLVGLPFGLSASAATTSTNVDIIVTHGAPLTTFTFVNNSGNTLPAGSPVSFGQAFRYGDITPGTYPLIRDAATHVALPSQQWDEISTWRENGGNGSWRHAVWAAWLPTALAPGGTYRIEFIATAGTYSQSSHQALSSLCSGPAAHDLKIRLTDVRNQNDTVRDSGDATFRLCDNIANTGRDAPRHLRAGNVYDEYVISGLFVYTSGHTDPLLYAQCNVDIFTKASDGVSPGDVRWVCHLHNSWENVAAGSTGNAGNPGPAGFANDPQAISYRPEIDDGASDVLDWSGLDATIASASNPVSPAASVGCGNGGGNYCMFVPSSVGANAWYYGQATRASCAGGCIGGVTNGQLYYIWPSSSSSQQGAELRYVALTLSPDAGTQASVTVLSGSQGSGSTTFSTRVQHYHFEAWQTLDASGQDNWSPFGTTTRVTRKVYPALTAAERLYWEQTGLIIPVNLAQSIPDLTNFGRGLGLNYRPFGKLNVIGGGDPGARPDLGISGEYATKAFITQAEADWDNARLFTLGTSIHGFSTLFNEATARVLAANNGPPVGPGGNGNGGSYAGLGAPQGQLTWGPSPNGFVSPRGKLNPAGYDIAGGTSGGTSLDHMPSFDGFTYMIFGDRHWLDLMQWHGNRDILQQQVGPGPELGQVFYRDNNAVFTDGNTYHYWGLMLGCYQGRGCSWLMRDVTYPATFGADPNTTYPDGVTQNTERSYFHDLLTENTNYWPLFVKFRDGPGSTGFSGSIYPTPNIDALNGTELLGVYTDTFLMTYSASVDYIMDTFLHEPLAGLWSTRFQRYYEGVCGGQLPGAPVSYYCVDYALQLHIHDGNHQSSQFGAAEGPYLNGTDALDFGNWQISTAILTGGQLQASGNPNYRVFTAGDTLKFIPGWRIGPAPLDQLPGDRWFTIMGPINNTNFTFYLQCNSADHTAFPAQCPVAGQAFTGFTRGGAPVTNEFGENPKYRFSYDPGPGQGYVNNDYAAYAGQTINGLKILGYNVAHATADFNTRTGGPPYHSDAPSFWWDPTIVVPGLPVPVNSIP